MVFGEEFFTDRRYSRYLAMACFIPGCNSVEGFPIQYRGAATRRREICSAVSWMQSNQDLAATGTGSSSGCVCGGASGMSFSQSQPSFRQECTVPILVRFSTMNGAPHFGHGSAMGMCG